MATVKYKNLDLYVKAMELRCSGMTYKEIGEELDVCLKRARDICLKYKNINLVFDDWRNGLTHQTIIALSFFPINDKKELLKYWDSGDLKSILTDYQLHDVARFLKKRITKQESLEKKYIKYLESVGYKITK